MPNHFHFVLWPSADNELPDFMAWLTTTHSKRWHASRGTTGTGAEDWPWGSLAQRVRRGATVPLAEWPVPRPRNWIEIVQLDVVEETQALQQAVCRSAAVRT
jgi:putative transposase